MSRHIEECTYVCLYEYATGGWLEIGLHLFDFFCTVNMGIW